MRIRPHWLRPQERRRKAALLGVAAKRRRWAVLLGVVALLSGAALSVVAVAIGERDPRPHSVRQAIPSAALRQPAVWLPRPAASSTRRRHRRHHRRAAPRPVRIEIPAIGVHARVIRLGLNRDRTLQVPRNFADTGWWAGGPRPGDPGPAVVVGHVDSYTGPAVYYRLRDLRRGDRIRIVRADRSVVSFTVTGIATASKAHFPTARVYGPTRGARLRLITCSGTFDRSTGHYLDNTIVFAGRTARR